MQFVVDEVKKMITAKEAKELYDKSGQEVKDFLSHHVEGYVRSAAESGHRIAFIHLGSLETFCYLDKYITPLQLAVVEKLTELGYYAQIKFYGDKYVPRGLQDDDGNGPMHQNYGIQIGW
jgi:hypothetical protein